MADTQRGLRVCLGPRHLNVLLFVSECVCVCDCGALRNLGVCFTPDKVDNKWR